MYAKLTALKITGLNKTMMLKNVCCFLLLCCLVLTEHSVMAQGRAIPISNDEGNFTKSLARKFKRDAARLALRMEAKSEDLRYLNIEIPQDNVENIYLMLKKIYQSDPVAQSIAKCNIHTFPNPSIDHFMLIFDREVEWAEPLLDGISETDSDEFNDLLDEHDLIIERHVQWNETEDALTIRSNRPLNMAAVANEFYNIKGIKSIDLGIPEIGGNDINLWRKADGWEIEYVLRFGSFVAGKGKVHIWKYKYLDDGSLKFLTEGGDPIPEYMRCHFESMDDVFMVRN